MTDNCNRPAGYDDGFGWAEARALPVGAGLVELLESRTPATLDDADVVDAMAAYRRLANACEGKMLALAGELDTRRGAQPRDCRQGRDISGRRQAATEVGAALRESDHQAQHLLRVAALLRSRLRRTAELLAAGRISLQQARLIADQIDKLTDPGLTAEVEAAILAAITADETDALGLASATDTETRLAARRAVAEAEPGQQQARHKRALSRRGLYQWSGEDGMGSLTLHHTAVDVELIYHRFGLLARNLYSAEDSRTLNQQVADLVTATLRGEVEPVDAATGRPVRASDLEDDETEVTLRRARSRERGPQINLTMTLGTAAGFSDQPGVLQSGETIPACLARQIAYQPDSTWYRMLTDPVGRMIDLSTTAYRPGAPLSRTIHAEHLTCTQIGCRRPADRLPPSGRPLRGRA